MIGLLVADAAMATCAWARDFEQSVTAVKGLLRPIKTGTSEQMLPAMLSEQAWLHGPGGRYVAEIVIPLTRMADAPIKVAAAPPYQHALQSVARARSDR